MAICGVTKIECSECQPVCSDRLEVKRYDNESSKDKQNRKKCGVGVQCKGCCSYKKRLFSFLFKGWKKGKCIRQSNHSNKKGVCWMTLGEGEY